MDIVKEVTDFFTRLFRQRVNRLEAQAKSKVYSAQVKARGAAAKAVNDRIDGAVDAGKSRVAGKPQPDGDDGDQG